MTGSPSASAAAPPGSGAPPGESSPSIRFFLPSLTGGGAERVVIQLASRFAAEGHDVGIICGRAEGPCAAPLGPGVSVIDLEQPRVATCIGPLRRYLREERPHVVMAAMTHANLVLLAAARLLGRIETRVVVQEVALLNAGRSRPGTRFREGVMRAVLPLLYRRADAVLAVSDAVADELLARDPGLAPLLRVLDNPIDIAAIDQLAAAEPDHPWLRRKTCPVILAVGRLAPEKDFATLLRAFARLRSTRPAKLLILGEGAERAALQALANHLGIAADVDMPGFAANPYSHMRRADVLAVSSSAEGFSLVLAEAMACGCNVVSTRCGSGPVAIVDGGRLGGLTAVGNADELAVALRGSLESPLPAEALRKQAFRFDIGPVAASYLSVLLDGTAGAAVDGAL